MTGREETLTAALLWLRNHYDLRHPKLKSQVLESIDRVLADGFRSWHAMSEFWDTNHPGVTDFHGLLIRWRQNDADGQVTKPGV